MKVRIAIDPKDDEQVSFHPYNSGSFLYKLWEEHMLSLGYKII